MGKGDRVNRRSVWRVVAFLLTLTTAGVACGSGGSNKSDAEAKPAPEEHRAPAAEVSAGLDKIAALAGQIATAAGRDAKSAKQLDQGIEPAWQAIEGTVRSNDKDLYIRFEDDFAALSKAAAAGDGSKAQQVAGDIGDAVKTYHAKFPG
jgi:hypothetical protein